MLLVSQNDSYSAAVGYTLATGDLWAPMREFHPFAEMLLGRPILTHEFGQHETWVELREAFENRQRAVAAAQGWGVSNPVAG